MIFKFILTFYFEYFFHFLSAGDADLKFMKDYCKEYAQAFIKFDDVGFA